MFDIRGRKNRGDGELATFGTKRHAATVESIIPFGVGTRRLPCFVINGIELKIKQRLEQYNENNENKSHKIYFLETPGG